MSQGELIIYRTEDGQAEIQLRVEGEPAWLTQAEIADLFSTTKQNVSLHVRNILKEGGVIRAFSCKGKLDNCR